VLAGQVKDDFVLEDAIGLFAVEVICSHKGSVGDDDDAILLGQLDQSSIWEVGMNLNLQSHRFDLAHSQQLHEKLSVEVGDSEMLNISLRHTKLHFRPDLFEGLVVELSIVGAVDEWPMQVQHVQVLELHQMKGFFHFPLDVLATKVPYLSGDKKLLTSHTALADYCLDRSTQSNLIIVQAGSVDVAASAQLKTLPQEVS
jgi:hypothetical protein